MTEMRTLAMGQYGHNNQPSHHILYLFAQLGDVQSTEQYVREVINRGYGVDFYSGDEDNGEMGAWFVLSALGLFSTTPGTPDYVLTSPLFKHVILHRSSEPHFINSASSAATSEDDFHIIARNAAPLNIHSTKILLNGEVVTTAILSDRAIQAGGVLQFFLENADTVSEVGKGARPETVMTIKEAREVYQQQQQQGGGARGAAGESEAAAEKREALQKEIEKQKRLISSLSNELAGSPPPPWFYE
jgi:putative alpha-1,2-mannosidase